MANLDDWDLVVALPAVALPSAIDAGHTAMVPYADARYQHLVAKRPAIGRFLGSFRTAFGRELQPAIVIRDRKEPRITAEDLTALRNIVALAAVVRARTDRCVHQYGGQGPVYSDLFEMYPVNLARDGEMVAVQTASEFGLDDDLDRFQGQPYPAYIYPEKVRPELDQTLLGSLVKLWRSNVRRGQGGAFRRRVLRSLEMAHQGLASPFGQLGSEMDHATVLSLWVSAFETLAHPGIRDVHFRDVEGLITKVPWYEGRLRRKAFRPIEYRKQPKPGKPALPPLPLTTRPVQVYQRLCRVRNESLHGGRVPVRLISGGRRRNHLHLQIPTLYRGVLLHLLTGRHFHKYPKEPKGLRKYGEYLDRRQEYEHYEAPLVVRCAWRR